MRRCQDLSAADWLTTSTLPWWRLVTLGPAGFDAYARLRYIDDPAFPGQRENDYVLPADHVNDLDQARRALRVLTRFTDTADDCYFALWEGFGDNHRDPTRRDGPLLTIPHRRFQLFGGRLAELDDWDVEIPGSSWVPPAFVWPADRRWCFTSDIDPHWAGIGAEPAAVDALLAATDIDVVPADPTERPPTYQP